MTMLNGEEVVICDNVWSPIYGWGVVEGFMVANTSVVVYFKAIKRSRCISLLIKLDSTLQQLYWEEVTIIPPEKPVKFVKKYIVCYKYKTSNKYYTSTCYYKNKEDFSKVNEDCVFVCLIEQSKLLMTDED